nr:PKD domain-containing protein [uncultured Psychroserpens sp.]
MKKALLILFTVMSSFIYAQEVIMQNGSITTCSGTFTDSGGEFGNYSSDEYFVFTICPDVPEGRLTLDFQEFATQLGADVMTIYNGDSVASPMFGTFSGANSPGLLFANSDNPSGCFTIEFVSNESANTTGWTANINCLLPCQDITAQLDSTSPLPNEEGIIEVCVGESVTLNGSGVFGVDGTGATYTWVFGDGNTVSGQSVTFAYDVPGVYLANFNIRDTNTDNFMNGCPNTNTINQIIRVSGEPDFTGVQAEDSTLCFGESTTIEAIVNPLTLTYNCPPPISEETFLPDGSGAAYSTCINVTCFDPNAVLTDISQLQDICINIEHSYSGDLDITLISPNGQEVNLFEQAGGGTYFGGANDDTSNDPGVGADYCFSMSAATPIANANTIIAGSNPPANSFEPGSYLPAESFDVLLGSPLNGEWCIQIIDNLSIDNGYIFSWELNFDPSVQLEDFTFIPNIVSQSWDPNSSITETNGNIITVAPDGSGEYCYTYRTVDEFGCEYAEEVCINVADENQPPITYYEDTDGDGYGDPNSPTVECSPIPPIGYAANSLDCDDSNNLLNPDASDTEGNGIDENCDGVDGDVLSVDEFLKKEIFIKPNPFNNHVTINLPLSLIGSALDVIIYDLNGRVVYDNVHSDLEGVITIDNLNTLKKAPYFLKISNKEIGFNIVKKIIKL